MLTLDACAKDRLKILEGKCLEINVQDVIFVKKFFCVFNKDGIQLSSITNQSVDMFIRGNRKAFLKLAVSKDPYLASRLGLEFDGDAVFLETAQKLFFNLNVDWIEALSQWTNDIIAHQVGKFIQNTKKQQREILENTTQSISEYLQEESKLFPTQTEVNNFLSSVDKLRAKVDRLEAKIEYLSLFKNKDI